MPPRFHNYSETGIPCGDGCLLLTDEKRLRKRATKYKVRFEDLVALIEATQGRCMVCRGCHASIVEHCHFTGRVRGIVCRWCNGRISSLEGGTDHRHVVYRRGGMGCPCITVDSDRPQRVAALEAATYRYLDHAMDRPALAVRDALAVLVASPFPD